MRWYCIDPYQQTNSLSTLMLIARQADVIFLPGTWLSPVRIQVPTDPDLKSIVESLLTEHGFKFEIIGYL